MRARNISIARDCVVAVAILLGAAAAAEAQSAQTRYESALGREPDVRKLIDATAPDASSAARTLVQRRVRQLVARYAAIVHRYPRSGYSDNALAQAGGLHQALFERYGREDDRKTAIKYYRRMIDSYPHSSLVKKLRTTIRTLSNAHLRASAGGQARAEAPAPKRAAPETTASPSNDRAASSAAASSASSSAPSDVPRAVLTDVQRTVLPEAVRVTLTFDREVTYREESIDGPARVFFDLAGVAAAPPLVDAVMDYSNDVVRQIRLGRHPDQTVRVVLDAEGVTRHSVFTLYNPYRIVIDCERPAAVRAAAAESSRPASRPPVDRVEAPETTISEAEPLKLARETDLPPGAPARAEASARARPPVPARETVDKATPPPEAPSANSAGGFSIARQLGLGVSRIVIDPGHGGRDPGVQGRGLNEATITLDVALRLEKLLLKEPGVEVVLTRRSNVYVPLEERTEIANREGADLFLSIHANASRNTNASGVETYYLSFASSPEAEAVAARENSASGSAMHNLPDIIKAIALNNKLDESRDFAAMVQESLVSRVRRSNKNLRDRGVKKAPFVVLIGANMPSILAEISFLSNRHENQLLRSSAYKQRIAEALHTAVMRYRRALKRQGKIAEQD